MQLFDPKDQNFRTIQITQQFFTPQFMVPAAVAGC